MSTHVISVANRKGGVSKTSTSLFLAAALACNKGKKVIYLDCDSQASAYNYREYERKLDMYKNKKEPFKIKLTQPLHVYDEIKEANNLGYDYLFIDVPRLTHGSNDSQISTLIAMCHTVLIPIKSGGLENISTADFLKIVKSIDDQKKEKGFYFKYTGFFTLTGKRPNQDLETKNFMKSLGFPLLNSELRNVGELSDPYTYESLLDIGKAERGRFEPFFLEVLNLIEE